MEQSRQHGPQTDSDCATPLEFVPVAPATNAVAFPEHYRSELSLDVIHDGAWVPREFLVDYHGRPIEINAYFADYVRERDWGASKVAERLAALLGIGGFARVRVARVLMDFGRFPGSTPRRADHLHRFAINFPFSKLLSYRQKKRLLEGYYDAVSEAFEPQLQGKRIKLAIHTYDQYNESGTLRPPVSVMTRSVGYQHHGEMPHGLFDPLFPNIIGEFIADRILRDRISLMLEKADVSVAHNFPYSLPEGSLEVRFQVWQFFNYLRTHFERAHPEQRENAAYRRVWRMLLDTNLRSSESEGLRSYMHMFRRASAGERAEFEAAELAYEDIARFLRADDRRIVNDYRFSPERASSMAIEVRKDLVFDTDAQGLPTHYHESRINRLAQIIAEAIATYLREDRLPLPRIDPTTERRTAWYSESSGGIE